jgi:hypothetical protein
VYLIEPSDKSGPSRVENRTNLQPCRFKERYTSDNDSDSTDDDSIAHMSVRINTLNDFVVFGVPFILDFITSFNMIS